jgi:predicted nucleotidyltransferase
MALQIPASLLMLMSMNAAPPSLETLRLAVRAVCKGRPVARVEVFGSVARGAPHAGSDVDLLVEFLPETQSGLFEMGSLKEDLEERLGCRVDLLSRRAVERSRNPFRRRAILAHPVTLYAR